MTTNVTDRRTEVALLEPKDKELIRKLKRGEIPISAKLLAALFERIFFPDIKGGELVTTQSSMIGKTKKMKRKHIGNKEFLGGVAKEIYTLVDEMKSVNRLAKQNIAALNKNLELLDADKKRLHHAIKRSEKALSRKKTFNRRPK